MPATWDETRVIAGDPGQFVVIARRSGSDWYLGAMTNWTPRDLSIRLDFLGEGKFKAETYADAPDSDTQPTHTTIGDSTVDNKTVLKPHLVTGGGLAIRFTPIH